MIERKRELDSVNYAQELEEIFSKISDINHNMVAIGMDYKFYIDSDITDSKIYEMRDGISYRLNAVLTHLGILNIILDNMDASMTSKYFDENELAFVYGDINCVESITALFDSIIFHTGSTFDYISNLVVYITKIKSNMDKWGQLANYARDDKHLFYNQGIGSLIRELDQYVSRLYKVRSDIIHKTHIFVLSTYTADMKNCSVKTQMFSSDYFNRHFSDLRKLGKDNDLTIRYVIVWLLRKTVDSIGRIQFGLKDYMEKNKKITEPVMFYVNENSEKVSPTIGFWREI